MSKSHHGDGRENGQAESDEGNLLVEARAGAAGQRSRIGAVPRLVSQEGRGGAATSRRRRIVARGDMWLV